jgi:hypothetical protein
MEFETLTRPIEDYRWALGRMADHGGSLDPAEMNLLINLILAADIGLEEFDLTRREAMMYQPRLVAGLIMKCQAHGFPMKWPE